MVELISLPNRRVFYLPGTTPACFYLTDERAGGVLINAPPFESSLHERLEAVAPLRFVFVPSVFGAGDAGRWRTSGAAVIASVEEAPLINVPIDQQVDRKVRLVRDIDFLPMSGRTRGSCALRVRASPSMIFFGPILDHQDWPTLVAHADDYSFENRLLGALGLGDLRFEFAFCDNYVHGRSRFGPGAARAVRTNLTAVLSE
ncbi:MAG: hypothetical protein LJE97_17485 [Betaproteobacteria bacterium]|nr:hypothetical protein [Betaproteobacteria bacterium]